MGHPRGVNSQGYGTFQQHEKSVKIAEVAACISLLAARAFGFGVAMFEAGQLVRVNLAGLQAGGVMFQAAVTDAVGHIIKQTSEQPPKYLVKLLFSFRGVTEVEVAAERIHRDK